MLKFEDSFLDFLDSHITLVDHHLGDRRGTNRSSGGNYLRGSKLSQIIWRDLYHLQTHASSVISWKEVKRERTIKIKSKDAAENINEEISEIVNKMGKEDEKVLDMRCKFHL